MKENSITVCRYCTKYNLGRVIGEPRWVEFDADFRHLGITAILRLKMMAEQW